MTDTRAEFEAAYIVHLKEEWPLNKCTPQDLAVMREGDGYGDGASHLAGAWWGWRAASVLGGEVVAWMRTYRQFRDSQSEAPDPGYMVTSFHQNAEIAAKYPDENVPLFAHPTPSAPAQPVALEEWKLVPVEPTPQQQADICESYWGDGWDDYEMRDARLVDARNMYQAMISGSPTAPAQDALASKPAVALGEELRSMLTRAYNAGWDASDACDNAYNNGNSERLETEIPQAHEPAVYQRWRATWFSNRDEVLRAIAASAAPAQSRGDAEQADEAEFKNFHRILCERFGYVHDEADWKRDQLSLIEHIAAKQSDEQHEWISVEDRMPDADVPVLVHNGRWTGVGAWMSDKHLEEIERWQDEQREFIELSGPAVTHWMPLPAALAARAKDSK